MNFLVSSIFMSTGFVTFMTVIVAIVAILLVVIVLMQRSKSGGGLGGMSGSASESFLGAGASSIMTKFTVALASFFLGVTLILNIISSRIDASGGVKSIAEKNVKTTIGTPSKKTAKKSVAKKSNAKSSSTETSQ